MTIYAQRLAERYDEKFPMGMKFDGGPTSKPNMPEYRQLDEIMIDRFARRGNQYMDRLLLHEKIALAEVNLRTRGLVGLVLGSQAPRLMDPPENMGMLHKEGTDIDVLILNEFSTEHPRPFEWGADWFVRPPNGLAPTNGLVRLWYDISARPNVSLSMEPIPRDPRLPFYLDYEVKKLKYDFEADNVTKRIIESTRDKTGNFTLQPGLYLPSADIVNKIRSHANRIKKQLPGYLRGVNALVQRINREFESGQPANEPLIKEAMEHLNKLNEYLNVLPYFAIRNETEFFGELKEDRHRLKEIVRILTEACESLAERCKKVCAKNHEYLDARGTPTKRALYPILSKDLLTFRPL